MTAGPEPTPAATCPFWRQPGGGEAHVCLARQGDPIAINARYVAAFCSQVDHVRCSLFLRADRQEPVPQNSAAGSGRAPGNVHAERTTASGEGSAPLRLTAPRITAPPNHARLHSTTIVVGGTAQSGSEVLVFEGQEQVGRVVAAASGHWEITLVGITPGEHRVYARCSDGEGRLSARSNLRALEVEADEEEELEPDATPSQPLPPPSPGKKAPFPPAAEARIPGRKPVDPAATVRLADMPAVLRAPPPPRDQRADELPPDPSGADTVPVPQLSAPGDETTTPIAAARPAEPPEELVLPATPSGGGEAAGPVIPPLQPAEVIPAEPPRRVEPVVDLIPVDRVPQPRIAEVVPLVPGEPAATTKDRPGTVEAAQVERPAERGEQTGEALQALAAYLRAVEVEPVTGAEPPEEVDVAPELPIGPVAVESFPSARAGEQPPIEAQTEAEAGATRLPSDAPAATRIPALATPLSVDTEQPGRAAPVPPSARRPWVKLLAGVAAVLLMVVAGVAIFVLLRHHPRSQAVAARTRSHVVLSAVPTPTAPAVSRRAVSAPARSWHFAAVHGQLDDAVLLISNAGTSSTKVMVTLSGAGGQETHVVNVPAGNAIEMELMPPTATDAISLQASAPVLSQRLLTHHGVVHTSPGQPVPPTATH